MPVSGFQLSILILKTEICNLIIYKYFLPTEENQLPDTQITSSNKQRTSMA